MLPNGASGRSLRYCGNQPHSENPILQAECLMGCVLCPPTSRVFRLAPFKVIFRFLGYGEPAEVRRGGSRGLHHPIEQGGSFEIELVRIEGNVDRGLTDFKAYRQVRGA